MGASCSCLAFLAAPPNYELDRAEFERTVSFLASVPLFKRQLPRSELPKVAQNLTRTVWRPRQMLVEEGKVGRAFFLIQSGEALVLTSGDPNEEDHVRATMGAGDYFGGHTLVTERPNVATIVAKGPELLVTLSMSRKAFEDCGLKRRLTFLKRPALYENRSAARDRRRPADVSSSLLTTQRTQRMLEAEEIQFICAALKRNANLRALMDTDEATLKGIAEKAQRREMPASTIVSSSGDIGDEFFVVREGSFEIVVDAIDQTRFAGVSESSKSAEAAVAKSAMAERILRKKHFLGNLVAQDQVVDKRARVFPSNSSATAAGLGNKSKVAEFMMHRRSEFHKKPESGKKARNASKTFSFDIGAAADSPKKDAFAPQSTVLNVGESFGELSLLYNTRRVATFRSLEPAVVYAIHRHAFKELTNRRGPRFREYCKLLDEVHSLSTLLSSERFELACSSTGMVFFKPYERVLHQGRVREARQWYVVFSGSGLMTQEEKTQDGDVKSTTLGHLSRASHFGERSLLRGDSAPQVNVDAGPEGMHCLLFDGELIRELLQRLNVLPSVDGDIKEWCAQKTRNWVGDDAWGRQESAIAASAISFGEWREVAILGRGAFGTAFLIEDTGSLFRYALKRMSKGHIKKMGAERQVRWERELLSMVDSPFVIRLYRTFQDDQNIYFLIEPALGGNLLQMLYTHSSIFTEDSPRGSTATFYAACLTSALDHLHERRIVYRDLKPENALLDARGYAKLCDMGFARFVLGKTNTLAGTPDYMAPEMIDFPHTHDTGVDWWALGVLMYELLSGQTPWEDEGISEPSCRLLAIRRSQESGKLTFPFHFPHLAKSFVTALLRKQHTRLGCDGGAEAVRQHQLFTKSNFDFAKLHTGVLKAPYIKAWVEPVDWTGDCMGGLTAESSHLFTPCDENDASWEGF